MAIQFAPIAGIALRYGTVALVSYVAARNLPTGRRDQRAEDAMDESPEGITACRSDDQMNLSARWCRSYRLGRTGPGVKIDIGGLGRIRVERLK